MLAVRERVLRESQAPVVSVPERSVRPATAPLSSFTNRATLFLCVIVGAGVLWALAMVGGRISATNNNIAVLQSQISQVSAENASLTAQVDQLTRPTRILNIALKKLHMQYATPVHITSSATSAHS